MRLSNFDVRSKSLLYVKRTVREDGVQLRGNRVSSPTRAKTRLSSS